ncbi:hypothetical protein T459_35791 [Capsicum annuum]|uniref:Uncharacterized protein n=1 Tax=Capsicum annuum TaxID=4072 RepID=A0A2G2UVI5_CAPAN|nr:hypothetical protein T459_35791 [Capsicum annuum]
MHYLVLLNVFELTDSAIDESEIQSPTSRTRDSEVTDPSTEAETECSPSEPACAESKSNSHASSELTDSAIDESEIQSPTSRTRGSLAAFFSNGVNRH